jgi:DNA polymerase-3 subunit alpha
MASLAVSDHGTIAGIHEHYTACNKVGIIPILGNEIYWKPDLTDKKLRYLHGCFYAKNDIGYKNLLTLSALGFDKDHHQFGRPVVSQKDIMEHSEGLIYSTGCMIGVIGVSRGFSEEWACTTLEPLLEAFKDRTFIEIGPAQVCQEWDRNTKSFHNLPDGCLQEKHNRRAMILAKKYGIPILIASDSHMAYPDLKPIQDLLIRSSPSNKDGWHFAQTHAMGSSEDFWNLIQKNHPYIDIKTYEQMIDNTFLVADLVKDLRLKFHPMIPKFPLESHPLYQKGMTDRDLMWKIIYTKNRIPKDVSNGTFDKRYTDRLKVEAKVICDNGIVDYTNYFLVLSDFVDYMTKAGEAVGPRGSAAGSLLAYLMGISPIDPIKNELSFERFFNIGRLGSGVISFEEFPFDKWEKNYGKL